MGRELFPGVPQILLWRALICHHQPPLFAFYRRAMPESSPLSLPVVRNDLILTAGALLYFAAQKSFITVVRTPVVDP